MTQATVRINDETFDPVRKQAASDTAVVWRNVSTAAHAVDSVQFHDVAENWQFRTQTLRSDDSAIFAFDQEGNYEYYCGLQGDDMCGVILVGDASTSRLTPL